MNKKAFITIITAMTVFSTQAQNTWEVPNSEKNKVPTENVAVKEKKSTNTDIKRSVDFLVLSFAIKVISGASAII